MLFLSRRIGETIVIDGSIRITVLTIAGATRGYVRLGIKAPGRPIVRAECLERPIDPATHAPSPAHAACLAGKQEQPPRIGGGKGEPCPVRSPRASASALTHFPGGMAPERMALHSHPKKNGFPWNGKPSRFLPQAYSRF